MSLLDILITAFITIPTLLGFWRGMLWPIAVLLGVVGGSIAAMLFGQILGELLFSGKDWAFFAAGAIIMALAFFVVFLVRGMLRSILKSLGLKWLDHILGGILSGLSASLALTWAIVSIPSYLPESEKFYEDSMLVPYVHLIACNTGIQCED